MLDDYAEDEVYTVPYLDNTAILRRIGPYGHFNIRLKKGAAPKEFGGVFTSIHEATKVIKTLEARRLAEKDKVTDGTAGL